MPADVRGKQLASWIDVLIKSVQSTPVDHEQTVPIPRSHMTAQQVNPLSPAHSLWHPKQLPTNSAASSSMAKRLICIAYTSPPFLCSAHSASDAAQAGQEPILAPSSGLNALCRCSHLHQPAQDRTAELLATCITCTCKPGSTRLHVCACAAATPQRQALSTTNPLAAVLCVRPVLLTPS